MRQIYYTQCPIGYGLGASNGFQIKRLSPGYPVSGDFRHFSLRAFVGGTRTMAPAALRYRRGDEGEAEIAWLTPRSHEYETERGPWGRPGGHFAHGLQLDAAELRALSDWPAGLYDAPFWTRSDREPSRGLPPPPLELSPADLVRLPTFESVAPLAKEVDPEFLARLLTALAAAAREGRTLFLIGEPVRVADLIALLTFTFPEPWRASLTFSTYHDRPEELPGFRLQGTIPLARPNRSALLALGFVADLAAGSVEPRIMTADWARTLAGWFIRVEDIDRADWETTRRRAGRARPPAGAGSIWSDDWLARMFGLPAMLRKAGSVPTTVEEWSDLAGWSAWVGDSGLAGRWAEARPPDWWRAAAGSAAGPDARLALLRQVGLSEAWRGDTDAAAWGEVVALWVRACPEPERLETATAALATAPAASRPTFSGALIRALPREDAGPVIDWLESRSEWDPRILLPLKALGSVKLAIATGDSGPLDRVLDRAVAAPELAPAVLDALAAEAREVRDLGANACAVVAESLSMTLEHAEPRVIVTVHRWALSQAEPPRVWLGPFWARRFAPPHSRDDWRALIVRLPRELAERVTRLLLGVALETAPTSEALVWGIEELVLARPEPERPHDPAWPGAYLDHLPSGLDLLRRLFTKEYRRLGARRWLEQARSRGELTEAQVSRLDDCEQYARALSAGVVNALPSLRFPAVPAEHRGILLGQILSHLGDGSEESINLALDRGRDAWPGGFEPGARGLDGLGRVLAESLLADSHVPERWFESLFRVLDRLGLAREPGAGFEPDGLGAEIVAATVRRLGEGFDRWRLRQFLLDDERVWKILAADLRQDLWGRSIEECAEVLEEWDQRLDKGGYAGPDEKGKSERFFELWLNVCEPPVLVASVLDRMAELRHFDLSWWESARVVGAVDDVRDRFARQAPMAPLPQGSLARFRDWLRPSWQAGGIEDFLPIEEETSGARGSEWRISEFGRWRWRCLEELTIFAGPGTTLEARWQRVRMWIRELPLRFLDATDRERFVGWLIAGFAALDLVRTAQLAVWLYRCGFRDPDTPALGRWYEGLASVGPVDAELRFTRADLVGEIRDELRKVVSDEAGRSRKTTANDSR